MEDESVDPSMSDSVKLGVLIHRVGGLETGLVGLGQKIDNFSSQFPTSLTLELVISPLRDKIKALEEEDKAKEREQVRQMAQLKLALIVAMISPLASFFIAILVGNQQQ